MVRRKCAVIQAVYAGDTADRFTESIKSISIQASENIEVRIYLAVDGPLPAELEDALARSSSSLYRTIRTDESRGLANALNALIIELEDEEFVFRMDSDDISLDGRFRAQISYMDANPHVDLCGTAIIEQDYARGVLGVRSFPPSASPQSMAKGTPLAHPTACMRRGFFDKFGKYPSSRFNQDIALWYRAVALGCTIGNVEEPYLIFWMGPNFAHRRGVEKAYQELVAYLSGIHSTAGWSYLFAYPLLRFMFRLMPPPFVRYIYRTGKLRNANWAPGDPRARSA